MIKPLFAQLVSLFISISLLSVGGFAAPTRTKEDSKTAIPHAIGVYVTARGQRLLTTDLLKILSLNGIGLDDVYFPDFQWEAPRSVTQDQLGLKAVKDRAAFSAIRETLKKWLNPLDFKPPIPRVELKDIEAKALFSRLSIRTDAAAQREAGLDQGIGFILEAEIPAFQLQIGKSRIQDLANDFLGTFGVDALDLSWDRKSVPLRIQLPVHLQADPEAGVQLRALALRTNLQKLVPHFGFARPLVLPQVAVMVNGHLLGQIESQEVENEILKQKDALTHALLAAAKEYLEKQLPAQLNSKFAELAASDLDDINAMDPPGAVGPIRPQDRFRFGMALEDASVSPQYLFLGLKGYIRDPQKPSSWSAPNESSEVRHLLNDLKPESYDVAVSLSQTYINRMLQLSFERGYFDRMEMGPTPADTLQLAMPPELHTEDSKNHERAKFKLKIRQDVQGLANLAVHSPIEISFDAQVHVYRQSNGEGVMMMDGIDVASAQVEDRFLRSSALRGLVMDNVRSQLQEKSDQFAAKPKALLEKLPLPSSIYGVPIQLKAIRTEMSGHILVYMEYGDLK